MFEATAKLVRRTKPADPMDCVAMQDRLGILASTNVCRRCDLCNANVSQPAPPIAHTTKFVNLRHKFLPAGRGERSTRVFPICSRYCCEQRALRYGSSNRHRGSALGSVARSRGYDPRLVAERGQMSPVGIATPKSIAHQTGIRSKLSSHKALPAIQISERSSPKD